MGKEVGFVSGVVYPCVCCRLKRWYVQSWRFVVQELSVDLPPLFGVSWERAEFSAEGVLMLFVGCGECVVGVTSCVVVIWCTFKVMFPLDGGGAGFIEPKVGVFFLSDGALGYVALHCPEDVVGEFGSIGVRVVCKEVAPVGSSEGVVE